MKDYPKCREGQLKKNENTLAGIRLLALNLTKDVPAKFDTKRTLAKIEKVGAGEVTEYLLFVPKNEKDMRRSCNYAQSNNKLPITSTYENGMKQLSQVEERQIQKRVKTGELVPFSHSFLIPFQSLLPLF